MSRRMMGLVVLTLCLAAVRGDAQEKVVHDAVSDVSTLDGKIVAITLMSDTDDLVLLSKVKERTLAGRKFLTGDGVDDGETPDWRNGAAVWIPIDDVQQVVTFANLDQYRKNLESRSTRGEGKAAVYRTSRSRRPMAEVH